MSEVLEIVQKLILLISLFYFAWQDYKKKLIPLLPIVWIGFLGILFQVLYGKVSIFKVLISMMVGGSCLLLSFLTKESIGIGDGFLFLLTGTFLEPVFNVTLFFGTLVLTGIFSIACLLLKKKGKKDEVAMAPFLLSAYVLFIL